MNYLIIDANNIFWFNFYSQISLYQKNLGGQYENTVLEEEEIKVIKAEDLEEEINKKFEDDEALFNFYQSLKKKIFNDLNFYIKSFNINNITFCIDSIASFRRKVYDGYKTKRTKKNYKIAKIIFNFFYNSLKEISKEKFINILEFEEAEADDLAYFTVQTILENNKDSNIFLISSDNDWKQILKFPNTFLYEPLKMRKKTLDENYETFLLKKAVIGDKSDNLIGIKGIGEKKFYKFIEENKMTDEQKKIIENNLLIIDIDKHPNKKEILEYIKSNFKFELFKIEEKSIKNLI